MYTTASLWDGYLPKDLIYETKRSRLYMSNQAVWYCIKKHHRLNEASAKSVLLNIHPRAAVLETILSPSAICPSFHGGVTHITYVFWSGCVSTIWFLHSEAKLDVLLTTVHFKSKDGLYSFGNGYLALPPMTGKSSLVFHLGAQGEIVPRCFLVTGDIRHQIGCLLHVQHMF